MEEIEDSLPTWKEVKELLMFFLQLVFLCSFFASALWASQPIENGWEVKAARIYLAVGIFLGIARMLIELWDDAKKFHDKNGNGN